MKLSKYNLWVKDYPQAGEYLVYNSRTQALIKINQKLRQELDNIGSVPLNGDYQALHGNGIVVRDDREEQDKLKDFFQQLQHDSQALAFEVTILTTYNCNFQCSYCFEQSVRDDVYLDAKTSNLIVNWLVKRAEQRKFKRIFLVYYGGEPLMNIRPIYDISRHLKTWADKNNVDFGFGIITNGSLVNPNLIDKLLTVGLKQIRITIDGPREEHNKKRPFSDGRGSFDLIIDNIKSIIDKVKVGVAGNFDTQSLRAIPQLLDYLEQEKLLYKLDKIDFAPLVPRLGPKNTPGSIELAECLSYIGKEGLFRETIAIKKELKQRGLKTDIGLAINACPLIMEDGGITIDPKGVIYKCNSLVGYPEFAIGNVGEQELNSRYKDFLNIKAWDKCPQDCAYLPMCQGGCRFFSYLESNTLSNVSCKKDYFDQITPDLIKLEYDKLIQG